MLPQRLVPSLSHMLSPLLGPHSLLTDYSKGLILGQKPLLSLKLGSLGL
jgi:hypothetical protein